MSRPTIIHDDVDGTPVVVVPSRQKRPNRPAEGCPFCPGGLEAPEPYSVHAFPNRWPALGPGRCEVVLFSPVHAASLGSVGPAQVLRVVELWRDRTEAMMQDPAVSSVLVFENRGAEIGATIPHPHGQIYAFEELTPILAAELAAPSCSLCIPPPETVFCSSGMWRAWTPLASSWPYEIRIASAAHVPSLAAEEDLAGLAYVLSESLRRLDALHSEVMPYMLWIHQAPRGEDLHLHIHIAPALRGPGTMRYVAAGEVGSGVMFNPVDPHQAAQRLRELEEL